MDKTYRSTQKLVYLLNKSLKDAEFQAIVSRGAKKIRVIADLHCEADCVLITGPDLSDLIRAIQEAYPDKVREHKPRSFILSDPNSHPTS